MIQTTVCNCFVMSRFPVNVEPCWNCLGVIYILSATREKSFLVDGKGFKRFFF